MNYILQNILATDMENRTKLNQLLEEAEANITLYLNGQDDNALERYNIIMESVKKLR